MTVSDEEEIKKEAADEFRFILGPEHSVEWGEIHLPHCAYYADVVVRNALGVPVIAAECKSETGCIRKGIGQALSYARNGVIPVIVAPNLDRHNHIIQSTPLWGMYVDQDYKLTSNPEDSQCEDITKNTQPNLGYNRSMTFTKRLNSYPSVEIPSNILTQLNITYASKVRITVYNTGEKIY